TRRPRSGGAAPGAQGWPDLRPTARRCWRRTLRDSCRAAGRLLRRPALTDRSAELLDAREHPTAAAADRLDEVPDLVDRPGRAVGLCADHAGEAQAVDVLDGSGLDAEQLGVEPDDVGAVGRALALVDLELEFGVHLGRGELAQVVQVAGVERG